MLICFIMTTIGFISGSIMYSHIIPKLLYKFDIIRESEDGNPGSANVFTLVGIPMGIICLILDVLKAFFPVYISVAILDLAGFYIIPVIIAPVLGHAFSPILHFKGGKAVSASYGVLLGVFTISKVVFILAFIMIVFRFVIIINPNSSKVIISYIIFLIMLIVLEPLLEVKIAALITSIVVCYKHYVNPNQGRLIIQIGRFIIKYRDKDSKLIKK